MGERMFYFATIDTYYAVSALADSREKAQALVVEKAKQYLDTAKATDPETGEPWLEEKIGDYFGIVVTALPMNSAEFEGCGD